MAQQRIRKPACVGKVLNVVGNCREALFALNTICITSNEQSATRKEYLTSSFLPFFCFGFTFNYSPLRVGDLYNIDNYSPTRIYFSLILRILKSILVVYPSYAVSVYSIIKRWIASTKCKLTVLLIRSQLDGGRDKQV